MSIATTAFVLDHLGAVPDLEEVRVEEPSACEVRVRLKRERCCYTDLNAVHIGPFVRMGQGHNDAGIVERVGAGRTALSGSVIRTK